MATKAPVEDGGAPAPERVTEASNPVTTNIDTASPVAIVRQLGSSDAQLFSGIGGHPGLTSTAQLQAMACTVDAMVRVLTPIDDGTGSGAATADGGAVVCTGSGTSGRLAYFVARAMNAALARQGLPPRFHYLIAGGDHALIKAKVPCGWQAAHAPPAVVCSRSPLTQCEQLRRSAAGRGGRRP